MGTGVVEQLSPEQFCTECGRSYPVTDLARFGDASVCIECKPAYVQRLREGTGPGLGMVTYGGFWRRAGAEVVDGFVFLYMISPLLVAASIPLFLSFLQSSLDPKERRPAGFMLASLLLFLVLLIIGPILYSVYFTKNGGSTPGKMMFGLKVVTASGRAIETGRCVGRFFARALSAIPLYIGFIIAGFDNEKRTLHDRICETRVIRIDPPVMGRRMVAYLLDSLVMAIVGYIVLIGWNLYRGQWVVIPPPNAPLAAIQQSLTQSLIPSAIAFPLQLFYSVYFTWKKSATPGKMALGLKVVTAGGGNIGFGRALARYLSTVFLGTLTLGIGLTIAFFTQENRALEDLICATRVVRAEN